MQPYLALLWLVDGLECKTGQDIVSISQVDPIVVGRSGFAVKESAPESSDELDINTVDCHG